MNSPRPREAPLVVATTATPTTVSVEIRGEVDVSNIGALHSALVAVELDGVREVRMDLQRLEFCDSQGARLLLLFNEGESHRTPDDHQRRPAMRPEIAAPYCRRRRQTHVRQIATCRRRQCPHADVSVSLLVVGAHHVANLGDD